jgi:hypothetical protein
VQLCHLSWSRASGEVLVPVIGSTSVAFPSEASAVLVVASAVPWHPDISKTTTKRVRGNRLSFILGDGMGMAMVKDNAAPHEPKIMVSLKPIEVEDIFSLSVSTE